MADRRQAVILIHGIGEQRPMTTLRSFVDALLGSGRGGSEPAYYSKPDTTDTTFELRRLVSTDSRQRTDFYEFYWAHLMPAAGTNRLVSWFLLLMWRAPGHVPARVRPVWWLSWAGLTATLLSGLLAILAFLRGEQGGGLLDGAPWSLLLLLTLLWSAVRSYVGDAAVYLSATPPNIEARQKIRAAGAALLARLQSDARYDRIIIVGHSLGSVIGYDMIAHGWQQAVDAARSRATADWQAGRELPQAAGALIAADKLVKRVAETGELDPAAWHACARALLAELGENGFGWKVSDFVTLGSPLTYADLLLADDPVDFVRRKRERELPAAPPEPERKGNFSFYHRGRDPQGRVRGIRLPHHAAPFCATRWTNLHFGCRYILWGDFVGGPVRQLFGPGVEDVEVTTNLWRGWLAHTHYWSVSHPHRETDSLPRLRQALDLRRETLPDRPVEAPAPASGSAA